MYCTNCGKELKDGAAFCSQCGARQGAMPAPAAPVSAESKKPGSKKRMIVLIAVGLIVAAIAVVLAVFVFGGKDGEDENRDRKRDEAETESSAEESEAAPEEGAGESETAPKESSLEESQTASEESTGEDDQEAVVAGAEDTIFLEYLENELIPQYGRADLGPKPNFISMEDAPTADRNWTGLSGIASSEICDLDNDGCSEMLILALEEENILLSIYEMENDVPVQKVTYPAERISDVSGYDVASSVVRAGDATYLFYKEEVWGILGDGYQANVALYRYDGTKMYMPIAVLQTDGGSSDFVFTAYEYDQENTLLNEEVVYDDHDPNRDSAYCYARVAQLFEKCGLILDGAAAANGEKKLFDGLAASQGYKELLSLRMSGKYLQEENGALYKFTGHSSGIGAEAGQGTETRIYEAFLNDEVPVDCGIWGGEESLSFTEFCQRQDSYPGNGTFSYLDLDNDGEKELVIDGMGYYGSFVIDARDNGLYLLAQGEGTAAVCSYTIVDGEAWIIHQDTMHMGRYVYQFSKYDGRGEITDEFVLSAEDSGSGDSENWYNENAIFTFRNEPITMQEFERLRNYYKGQ